jgi:hypothetical protein
VHDPQVLNLWTILVPQMGFDHEFLQDAILSSSAFHLSALLPDEMNLVATGYKYYGDAVAKHREALSNIDHSTAEPLCFASVLIMFQTLKISCKQQEPERDISSVQWFRILGGMGRLIRLSLPLLAGGGLRLLLNMEDPPVADEPVSPELRQLEPLSILLLVAQALGNDGSDADADAARRGFWYNLSQAFSMAAAGNSKHRVRRRLLTVAATIEEGFLQLMEREDSVSLILLFYYFSLLKWVGGHWWLQSSLDIELGHLLSLIPTEYHWAVGHQVCES